MLQGRFDSCSEAYEDVPKWSDYPELQLTNDLACDNSASIRLNPQGDSSMKLHALAFAPALLAAAFAVNPASAYGAELIGGYAITYAKGAPYDAGEESSQYTESTNVVSTQSGVAGFTTSARSQTSAWNNKIETTSDLSSPPAGGIAYAAALSLYAVNQIVSGPGATVNVSYQFNVDGSFAPGPPDVFPPISTPQSLGIYLVGYYGTAEDIYLENGVYYLKSEHGLTTLNLLRTDPRYQDDAFTFIIPGAAAAACPDTGFTCLGETSFDDQIFQFDADIDVGRPFTVVALVNAFTNGQTDFFNTVKLKSIALDPAFTLTADDGGALTRNSDGTYALAAAAVPEPATWATMLLGFGLIGAAMRYRRRPKAGVSLA